MSLLKLTARLRAHDWMAAVIELTIVVAGILIALQVSNWNQERGDRARSEDYSRRIRAELVADVAAVAQTRKFWGSVSAYGNAAMAFGETGQRTEGSNWKTVLAYYQASQVMPFQLEDTTFTEMRDSGDLSLIADEKLRKRLADYYRLTSASVIAIILRHDPVYRVQIRGLTPWRVQQYIWSNCFRQLAGTDQELIDCPPPISDAEAAAILVDYRRSETLLQNLRSWMSTLRVSGIVIEGSGKESQSLMDTIDAIRSPR